MKMYLGLLLLNLGLLTQSSPVKLSNNDKPNKIYNPINLRNHHKWKPENGGQTAPAGNFLILTQGWAMGFCCNVRKPTQCNPSLYPIMDVHGLWPQYETHSWPQFCNATNVLGEGYDFTKCHGSFHDPAYCHGGAEGFKCDLPSDVCPGYCGKDTKKGTYLANHEYPKHGSCMGLEPLDYFAQIWRILELLPHTEVEGHSFLGTPPLLFHNVGKCVTVEEIEEAYRPYFGVRDNYRIECNGKCYLEGVTSCWDHKDNGKGGHIVDKVRNCGAMKHGCEHCRESGVKLMKGYKAHQCDAVTCSNDKQIPSFFS